MHAEVIQITYDARIVSYETILIIFMTTHNPTQLNRQGADVGTQYRSVIYYHNDSQKEIAGLVLKEVAPYYEQAIVTEISPLETFYEAEEYHQDYYRNNQSQGYCSAVISPKISKLRKMHADKIKRTKV